MRVKLLTFRYTATLGGFDDTALSEFIRNKEVLSFREHFFTVNDVPHLTCVVTYQDPVIEERNLAMARELGGRAVTPAPGNGARPGRRERDNSIAGLAEADRVLFNTIREWRAALARTEGVPPYIILTNRQLIEIVQKKPESLTALGNLEGIGKAKIKSYGEAILNQLHASSSRKESAPSQASGVIGGAS